MQKKNIKLCSAFILTAVAAFIAGTFFNFLPTSGKAVGDVKRAKVYTANVVEIDSDNLQERLRSDSVFCLRVTGYAQMIKFQVHQFEELIRKSNEMVGGNDYFDNSLLALNVPYQSVLNACTAVDAYVNNLSILSEGGKVSGFEQGYNNALLGYYLVSSKSGIVDFFRSDLAKYMSEQSCSDDIKALCDEWVNYAILSDIMSGNSAMSPLADIAILSWRNQEQLNRVK